MIGFYLNFVLSMRTFRDRWRMPSSFRLAIKGVSIAIIRIFNRWGQEI